MGKWAGVLLIVALFPLAAFGKYTATEFVGKSISDLPVHDKGIPRFDSLVHGADSKLNRKYGVASRTFGGQGFVFLVELTFSEKGLLHAGLPPAAKIIDAIELPALEKHEMFYFNCRSKLSTEMLLGAGAHTEPGTQNVAVRKAWHVNLTALKIQTFEPASVLCMADGSDD